MLNEALPWGSTMKRKPAAQAPAVPAIAVEGGLAGNVFYLYRDAADLIARLNAVSVTGEDMILASSEIQKLPLETCNREARTRCLTRIFNGGRTTRQWP